MLYFDSNNYTSDPACAGSWVQARKALPMSSDSSKAVEPSSVPWTDTRFFRWACLAGFVLLLGVYLVSVGHRYLINDDFQGLYTSWLKAQGKVAGRDYFLTSYYLLTDIMAPLFRLGRSPWFPVYFMRCFFIVILGWTLVLLARVSRTLFDEATGWVLPIVLLATTALLHRGLDLRPDLIANLLWVAILLQLLSGKILTRKSILLVGAMLALVTLNRFKGLMIVPLVLGAYGYHLRKAGRGLVGPAGRIVLGLALGTLVVLLPYLGWVAYTDGMGEFLRVHRTLFTELGKSYGHENGVMVNTLLESLRLDYLFWGLTAWGLVLRARRWRAYPVATNLMVAGLLLTAVATVVLNPAYYAYNLMTLQTFLAPFAAYGAVWLLNRAHARFAPSPGAPILAACLLFTPMLWNWEAIQETTHDSMGYQKDLQRFILENLRPDQAVFSLEGLGLYRPSVFHWRFPAVLWGQYARGDWNYVKELGEVKPELIILSYRLPGWLTAKDQAYIRAHYVFFTPLLMVPGFASAGRGPVSTFEVLVPGSYEVLLSDTGTCTLDGQAVRNGEVLNLALGNHPVVLDHAQCLVRRHYSDQAKALVHNPEGLPYLCSPGLRLPAQVVDPNL